MFKTFQEFLTEAKTVSGNYVSIGSTVDLSAIDARGGVVTKSAHVTLMYSKDTDMDRSTIQSVLDKAPETITAKYKGVDIFENDGKACVVILLESAELMKLHNQLVEIGLKHSFDYTPHLTVAYEMTSDGANELKEEVEELFSDEEFPLSGYVNQEVIEDWATKE